MEVNSGISDLMREWLTEGTERSGYKCKKSKSFWSAANVFQPRPERLGLGAAPRPAPVQSCSMNKIRRNISKRIKNTVSLYQEHTQVIANGHTGCHGNEGIVKGLNEDEGSRSLAFCSRMSVKTTTSNELLKLQKKRKRRKKTKDDKIQDKELSPVLSLSIRAEESVPTVADITHKSKKRKSRWRYGPIFQPQMNCTRLRWRRCFVKRMPHKYNL